MTITLSELRLYAAETAMKDVAGSTADREIERVINRALSRVHRGHDWNYYESVRKLVLVPAETGSAMTLTQGSRVITLTGEVLANKYLDDEWSLHVTGEGTKTFKLTEIVSPTEGRLREGDEWTQATSATTAYTWSRDTFDLPEDAAEVRQIESTDNRVPALWLSPAKFDSLRNLSPTNRGEDPIYYTIRGRKLQIWSGAGSSYKTLLVTYRRKAPSYSRNDSGATVVDWDPTKRSLLEQAIEVEASRTQGDGAAVPYALARVEFDEALDSFKAEDTDLKTQAGPIRPSYGQRYRDLTRVTNYPSSLPEV